MRRRWFVGQGLAASAAVLGWGHLRSRPDGSSAAGGPPADGPQSLVIGAGLAGLACAQRLIAAGHAVVVLEARQRLGGRIWTDRRQGWPIELGASWLHGLETNPLVDLVERQLKLPLLPTDDRSRITIGPDGQPWTAGRSEGADAWLAAAMARAQADGRADQPLRQWLPSQLTGDQRFLLIADVEHELGADLDAIAADAPGGDGQELLGGDALVPAGLDRLVAHLAQGVDIRLGQQVSQINNRADGVTVTTAGGQVFQAQRLCCTVPLGVLQRGAIRFDPPLPAAKAQAIAQLGMGVLDKIVLVFGERFWGPQTWIRNDSAEPGLWAEWVDLTPLIGRPALMGFNAASQARQMARRSDDGIVASALGQLRRCYPQATIGAPLQVWLTRWGDDPFAFGSYSYPAVGPVPATALRQELGRRWQSLVLAGEAASTAFPATMQGAYLSGREAAERLLA